MKAVIMCGGSGTRLWPISRKSSPKQFVPLFNGQSLFQKTIERNREIVDEFIIVVNNAQLDLCKEQIPKEIREKFHFIIEPIGRNTAPAICLAAHLFPQDELLILASDHLIQNIASYKECIDEGTKLTRKEKLVTFGIIPNYPETGYGYIESNGNEVLSFKEKPNLETAKKYIENGNYFWNSGMFLFYSNFFLKEMESFAPEIYKSSLSALKNSSEENQTYYINEKDMMAIPEDSIDYALMEKSKNVNVVPASFSWNDVGSFDSLYTELDLNDEKNTKYDQHISINSKNNLILGNKKLIATFDIDDLIIVDTPDALLIGKRGKSQQVKNLVQKVKDRFSNLLQ